MQELKAKLEFFQKEIKNAKNFLNFPELKKRIAQLEKEMGEPDFWKDRKKAKEISRKLNHLKKTVAGWEKFEADVEETLGLIAEIDPNKDPQAVIDLREVAAEQEEQLKTLNIQLYLGGKYDRKNAILSVHAGTGGTDAQDWGEMLLRMYLRYAEKRGWEAQILEKTPGEEAGIKSVTVLFKNTDPYGFLKEERGVHRLVRLSPFNIKHTRETSFALVEVVPEIEEEEAEIKKENLRIETFRARGHGGQSVNTTDSAVRITHLPTGLSVQCQDERSQLQNKNHALKILKARLVAFQEQHQLKTLEELKGEHIQSSWGNQIRSYVLHPYQMVKDHRTNFETSAAEKVLDGDLDELIEKSLRFAGEKKRQKPKKPS